MTLHRLLNYSDRLPVAFVDPIQEFISTQWTPNFIFTLANPTTIQVVAGTDNAQVGVGINGRWRYNTATAQAAHPGGAAGTYDIYVTATDNSYAGNPEVDSTNYSFGITIKAGGVTPSPPLLWRKVGNVVWDGTKITKITLLANGGPFDPTRMVETVSGTTAAIPAPAAAPRTIYVGDAKRTYFGDGAEWIRTDRPPTVTSLPSRATSIADDRVTLAVAHTGEYGGSSVYWDCIYDPTTGDNNRWKFAGGFPLMIAATSVFTAAMDGAYHLGGPILTVPFAGIYDVEFGALLLQTPAGAGYNNLFLELGVQWSGYAPSPWAQTLVRGDIAQIAPPALGRWPTHLGGGQLAAGDTLQLAARVQASPAGTLTVNDGYIILKPIRLLAP